MYAAVRRAVFTSVRYISPSLSAIGQYIRFYILSATFIVLLSPLSGMTPQWGAPATLIFVFSIKNRILKTIATLLSGISFAIQYAESMYNMPFVILVQSNQDFFDLLKVTLVPVVLIGASSFAALDISRRLSFTRILRKLLRFFEVLI